MSGFWSDYFKVSYIQNITPKSCWNLDVMHAHSYHLAERDPYGEFKKM